MKVLMEYLHKVEVILYFSFFFLFHKVVKHSHLPPFIFSFVDINLYVDIHKSMKIDYGKLIIYM